MISLRETSASLGYEYLHREGPTRSAWAVGFTQRGFLPSSWVALSITLHLSPLKLVSLLPPFITAFTWFLYYRQKYHHKNLIRVHAPSSDHFLKQRDLQYCIESPLVPSDLLGTTSGQPPQGPGAFGTQAPICVGSAGWKPTSLRMTLASWELAEMPEHHGVLLPLLSAAVSLLPANPIFPSLPILSYLLLNPLMLSRALNIFDPFFS